MRERGKTCSKGSQVGPEAWAAAARIKPLYMGHALCRLSYYGVPNLLHSSADLYSVAASNTYVFLVTFPSFVVRCLSDEKEKLCRTLIDCL